MCGKVSPPKGDFVDRQKIETHILDPGVPDESLIEAYYRSLARECRRLPLGVIDTKFVRTEGEEAVFLTAIYVDLDVIAAEKPRRGEEQAWAARAVRGEGGERTPLLKAISERQNSHAVLLGDPGSGKTTFVNYLTWLIATGSPGAPEKMRSGVVVRLVLRDVVARHISADAVKGQAEMLWDALREDLAYRLGVAAAGRLIVLLRQRLTEQGGLLLLDGLDEVPEAQRRRETLMAAVGDLISALPRDKLRVLLTARPYAYADPRWQLKNFPILTLAPLTSEQSARFIARFMQAVRASMGWNEALAGERAARLTAALNEKPYLGDLAKRPLLLTLMATLHSSWDNCQRTAPT